MLQFLTPWWLLALPAVALPWLWPLLKPHVRQPQPFSAFFLLPPETLRHQLRFTRDDLWLKLLRSLLVLLAVLLLARPYWLEEPPPLELWVIDNSASTQAQSAFRPSPPGDQMVRTFSDLFPVPPEAPQESQFDQSFFAGTPNLSEIGQALLNSLPESEQGRRIIVHLISDFQRSQYWPYAPVALPIEWKFERPDNLQAQPNLGLRQLQVRTQGKLEAVLTAELFGAQPQPTEVRIVVQQGEALLHESVLRWDGQPSRHSLPLNSNYQHHVPLQISIEPRLPDPEFDNRYYFQSSRGADLRVGIWSTEGVSALYRYGLHPLKSALNANAFYSFLFDNPRALEAAKPDLLILLADDPRRFPAGKPDAPVRLFIPTRLEDWRTLQTDNQSHHPIAQQVLDWSQANLGETWSITSEFPGLFRAAEQQLWLLDTGLASAWGPLYQQQGFVDQLRTWLTHLWQSHPQQQLGSWPVGQPIPQVPYGWRIPGHYEVAIDNRTFSFAINLAEQESLPDLLTDAELQQMQNFFSQQAETQEQELAASDTLQDWLRWLLLLLLLLEVLWVVQRIRSSEPSAP